MRVILLCLPLIALVFSGCTEHVCPEPKVIKEVKYIKKPLPSIPERPIASTYKAFRVNLNGKDYVALTKEDATIMGMNWESYKNWSETNYKILKSLEDNSSN